ncbi:MAG: sigma-54-dependent Fis family transcriptional regulator [Desulfobacteraceae bacterium]|nr:MAG: sigma-54-dependent Fis family transcriptional regulator [Desulfobacteraceae bacterium]
MAKILIIDDDELFCSGLAEAVSEGGNEVICAYTIAEGLKVAAAGSFDIVFLDVVMPDGDGLEKISEIQAVSSHPEIIILTGRGTSDGAELAIRSGAWDYIQKPFSLSVIRLHLKRSLQYREERRSEKPAKTLRIDGIIGKSARMKSAFDLLSEAASTDVNVLITGETGTGKELFAKAIHNNSTRSGDNFVVVDCAAIQGSLIESILFGYEKGAFTGASQSRGGLITQADKGTLFLDEIAELPVSVQKAFLRVIQERRFRPVGCKKEIESNFRLISATNRNLESMVSAGEFRKDLLYRLRSLTIDLPPLREHREDIIPIATYHLEMICRRNGLDIKTFSPDLTEALLSYAWPGNVRELVNAVEGSVASASSASTLFRKHLPASIRILLAQNSAGINLPVNEEAKIETSGDIPTLKELRASLYAKAEKQYLQDLIKITAGDMEKACGISALSQPRMYELLRKHGISTKA